MDVNGTRFHLVLRSEEWLGTESATSAVDERLVEWDADGSALTLAAKQFVFPTRPAERPPALENRRGAARDRYGNWYWIDEDERRVLFLGATRAPELYWPHANSDVCAPEDVADFVEVAPPAPQAPALLRGLTITEDNYLIVGTVQPMPGLLVFDLHAGGPPEAMRWPASVSFAPFDMASAANGMFWILDYDNQRLWSVDRFFRVRALGATSAYGSSAAQDFQARDTQTAAEDDNAVPCAPDAIQASMSVSLDNLGGATAVEALPGGDALLLAGRPAALHRYGNDGWSWGWNLREAAQVPRELVPLLGRVHEIAFSAPADASDSTLDGTVYAVAADGNQAFAFEVHTEEQVTSLRFVRAFFPMRRFEGRALVSTDTGAYYDALSRWTKLAQQPKPIYEARGTLELPAVPSNAREERADWAFDGREPGCVWHRIFLDACIPPGAQVLIESRAADTRLALRSLSWQLEPAPYLRSAGPELPYERARAGDTQGRGVWELLMQNARGRFLQLRVTLTGTSRNTPRLQALRIYYPRFSYLVQYLPDVYQDDDVSASFLDRFLANTEGFFTEWEGRIALAQQLLDTRTVPGEFLEWLSGWLGASLDLSWDERTRRLFLSHAPQFFRERGTLDGVRRAVQLALSECPDESLFAPATDSGSTGIFGVRVVEKFLSRRAAGVVFGDPTEAVGPGATTALSAWTPSQGAEPLHRDFRSWLRSRYTDIDALKAAWARTDITDFDDVSITLSPVRPAQSGQAADWQRFLQAGLGFVYAEIDSSDATFWREFLVRRYRHIVDLNTAYGLTGTAELTHFNDVTLPAELPSGGVPLREWILFVSVVVPTQRNAHRFSVLVPVGLDESEETQRRKLDLASRITGIEKPAHTRCEVRLYWGMFRVGEARLGIESVIGKGSRFAAIVLGHTRLAEGHLAWREPWNARRRVVIGRDRIAPKLVAQTPEERTT